MEQKKIKTYLLYAIGEIALVMIGILLALQVNNWNEDRKDFAREQEYLNRLLDEARANVSNIDEQSQGYLYKAKYNQSMADYLAGTSDVVIEDLSSSYGKLPYFIQTLVTGRSVYNEIVSSGNLTILQDDTLRTLLDAAYAYSDFANRQTAYWRNLSSKESEIFREYRVTTNTFQADTAITLTQLDVEKMKDDPQLIEMVKFWAGAQIIFYDGFQSIKNRHQQVVNRIEKLLRTDEYRAEI